MQSPQFHSNYLHKQVKFKSLVKEVQTSLDSKEYVKLGLSFDQFVKAYRYLLSAKVSNQLEEFTVQPNYECLCRTLAKYAKTTSQMKLLWSSILKKVNNKLELITTPLVTKVWKELSSNKQYSHICHFEDEIMNKLEKYSVNKQLKRIQMNKSTGNSSNTSSTSTNVNQCNSISYSYSSVSTPTISYSTPTISYSTPTISYSIPPTTSTTSSSSTIIYSGNTYNSVANNYYSPVNSPHFIAQTIIPQNNGTTINHEINTTYIPVSIPLSPNSQCSQISTTDNQIINSTYKYCTVQSNTVESMNNIYNFNY
ncbi:hypothetical protein PIROE2DRAFT_8860 [Piromyces sp. E2]|nr:hypothetical protein PIROE2DRAFT_8860 [Piromyces sp. E2]|eukprot:OUM64387.1 hypothetical protein PIROE2DRAFT_8860 [Piromyces sp. E2]